MCKASRTECLSLETPLQSRWRSFFTTLGPQGEKGDQRNSMESSTNAIVAQHSLRKDGLLKFPVGSPQSWRHRCTYMPGVQFWKRHLSACHLCQGIPASNSLDCANDSTHRVVDDITQEEGPLHRRPCGKLCCAPWSRPQHHAHTVWDRGVTTTLRGEHGCLGRRGPGYTPHLPGF